MLDPSTPTQSIYDAFAIGLTQAEFPGRRRRVQRTRPAPAGRPPTSIHRREVFADIIEACLKGPSYGDRALQAQLRHVEGLETWVESRLPSEQKAAASIRLALDHLRSLGRWVPSFPLGDVDGPVRSVVVTALSLEHRWCYAAAGTRRTVFERELARRGAR